MKVKFSLSQLGPGLLYAGAAVGVSHLVQSTRAGADFGLWMILIVILSNLVKYPFFEFGSRYTASKKESILNAYSSIGKWALVVFLLITFSTMFVIQAAIVSVTAGIAQDIFSINLPVKYISALILAIVLLILLIGKLKVLNKLMKIIIISLAFTSMLAAVISLAKNFNPEYHLDFTMDLSKPQHLFFLIALIGWMPAPLDITIWQSVWTKERINSDDKFDLKSSLFDFNVGYWGTALLAVFFVVLGSMTMYNTGVELASGGAAFSAQLLGIFTTNIGSWSYAIIATAAFTTMLSTNLSVMDAYPRVIPESFDLLSGRKFRLISSYNFWLFISFAGSVFIVFFLMNSMKQMVDLATTMSFLTAPLLAYLNLKSVQSLKTEHKPELWKMYLSYFGLFIMIIFSLVYLYVRVV